MEWCDVQFQLNKRQSDGSPLRVHLLAIPEHMQNAKVRDLLREREAPTRLLYLFDAFIDLSRTRRSGFNAPEPIGYDQLYFWQQTIGIPLQRWEVDAIYRIDAMWIKSVMPAEPKPVKKVADHAN